MSTIAAISTPNAAGGIGIIRLSGEDAFNICEKCFSAYSGKRLNAMKGYTAALGELYDGAEKIDEAVLIAYRAPKSYTGENVAEICCHGGLFILQRTLRTLFSLGAVPAAPGEFTKRAFLNGKLDLAQAESVMNIISAQGEAALNAAQNTLSGAVSRKIESIAQSLVSLAAALAAWADYPDEDIGALDGVDIGTVLKGVSAELEALIKRYDCGRAVTEGVNTVICGKPNVGKSSLMNLLLGRERSIVTPIAGTTRDIIEESVRVGDIVLRLADTAGLRETSDEIESAGVEIAKRKIDSADLIIAVFDVSRELCKEDYDIMSLCENRKALAVINKGDLQRAFSEKDIAEHIPACVTVSAKDEKSTELIGAALERLLGTGGLDFSQEILAGERQLGCVKEAQSCVEQALSALNGGLTADAVNVSVDCAIDALYTLTGKKASEEIVNEVFRKFCVGK